MHILSCFTQMFHCSMKEFVKKIIYLYTNLIFIYNRPWEGLTELEYNIQLHRIDISYFTVFLFQTRTVMLMKK